MVSESQGEKEDLEKFRLGAVKKRSLSPLLGLWASLMFVPLWSPPGSPYGTCTVAAQVAVAMTSSLHTVTSLHPVIHLHWRRGFPALSSQNRIYGLNQVSLDRALWDTQVTGWHLDGLLRVEFPPGIGLGLREHDPRPTHWGPWTGISGLV